MDDVPISFADWLATQLRERGLSQGGLAFRSGVHRSTISRLISGQRAPSLAIAGRLVAALAPDGQFHRYWAQDPAVGIERALESDPYLSLAARRRVLMTYRNLRSAPPGEPLTNGYSGLGERPG